MRVEFIETPLFTRCITELLSDDDYRELQEELIRNPKAGDVIPGGDGLRKFRWRMAGRGKRGGIRVIYYCWSKGRLVMYHAYDKTKQGDLTSDQLSRLRSLVRALSGEAS